MEGPIIGDNQPESILAGIIRGTTMANGMLKKERHSSVYLLTGAQTKLRRLENRLRR